MSYLPPLRSFVEVYWCGSVTRAAKRLGLTQPAVSGHLRTVESLMGRALFTRSGRRLVPTPVADDLASAVGNQFASIDSALATLRARSTHIEGTVHLAGPAEYVTERVTPAVARLTHYGLSVRVQLGNREKLYGLLHDGAIDLALTASRPSGGNLDFVQIDTETLLLVADPSTARRFRATSMSVSDLCAERWVGYDEDLPLIREYFEHHYGRPPNLRSTICVADLRAVRSLVEQGAGLSVLPDYLCAPGLEAGTLVVLGDRGKGPRNELFLSWNRANLRHPRVVFARDQLVEQLSRVHS